MKNVIKSLVVLSASLGLMLTNYPPNEAVAKTKKETQHDIFKKLKLNASMTSVAEVMYGKSYKKHLCDRSEDEVKVNLLCSGEVYDSNKYDKDEKLKYLKYEFYLYPNPKVPNESDDPDEVTFQTVRMLLVFKSKEHSKQLKLVEKHWFDSSVVNSTRVYNNQKIKKGMTKKQLDDVLTGTGIGKHERVAYIDYSKVGKQAGKKQPVFPKAYKTYSYSVLNQKENVLYYFETKYSRTKKEYVVSYVDTWTEDKE
ncbi:hypothetical protein QK289_13675 [Exiguobacterium antarcticum]|uniref:Uncharacterized protein n=1 Tax=Exiguobacterium antarcticum TaxID=132920 RepID=A0ABT6R529_9BACL|nr:hypothetical protein [Exiguobacterium antarcticum]MDI3236060.1 hypothetical protein [Exiguobacterium antarcticum]